MSSHYNVVASQHVAALSWQHTGSVPRMCGCNARTPPSPGGNHTDSWLGWLSSAGVWQTYVLPPRQGASSSDTNMLRVLGDWNGPSAAFNLFLEYR